MKTLINFILFVAVSCLLFSCQKELSIDSSLPSNGDGNNSGNTSIIGDWSFISADMDVTSSAQAIDDILGAIKIIMSYKTTTINNKGSLKITTTDFQSTDFAYSISAKMRVQSSVGGIPAPDQEMPFDFDIPASSSSGKYQQIGSDSLYFPDGAMISVPDGAGGIPSSTSSGPTGTKFTIVSDTLKLFGGLNNSFSQNINGQDFSVIQKAAVILKYKRK